jgi:hypothetical protein
MFKIYMEIFLYFQKVNLTKKLELGLKLVDSNYLVHLKLSYICINLNYQNMKKLTYIFGFLLLFATGVTAQNFDGHNIDVGVGIGLGSPYTYGSVGIPPIFAQVDFGVWDKVSVGGTVGYATSKFGYTSYNWRYSYLLFGVRGNYHWGKHIPSLPKSLDLYAGLNGGFYIVNANYDGFTGVYNDGVSNSPYFGGQVGARWFFKDNIAALAEVGAGIAYLKIGIDFRLK